MGITSKGFPRDNHSLGVPKKQVLKATEKLQGHKLQDFPSKWQRNFKTNFQGDLPASSRVGKSQPLLEQVLLQQHLALSFPYTTLFCLNSCHVRGWRGMFPSWMHSPWARFQCFGQVSMFWPESHFPQLQHRPVTNKRESTNATERLGEGQHVYSKEQKCPRQSEDSDFVSNYLCSCFFCPLPNFGEERSSSPWF